LSDTGYNGLSRVTDGTYGYDAVNASHHLLGPDSLLIASEGCSCPGVDLGNWLRAERLGHDIMFDLQNHAQGWIDWNLLVDAQGGPNHLGNMCDASLVTSDDFSDVVVQPKFHYLGHFSKFLRPGAVRVRATAVGNYSYATVDPNIHAGVELGMFDCEQSVRQLWLLSASLPLSTNSSSSSSSTSSSSSSSPDSERSKPKTSESDVHREEGDEGEDGTGLLLILATPALTMDVSYPGRVHLCAAQTGQPDRPILRVVDCTDPGAALLRVDTIPGEEGHLRDRATGLCVGLVGDVREPGALLELAPCQFTSAPAPAPAPRPKSFSTSSSSSRKTSQKIAVDKQYFAVVHNSVTAHGVVELVTPRVSKGMCLTAGWPFLTAVAVQSGQASVVGNATQGASNSNMHTQTSVRGPQYTGASVSNGKSGSTGTSRGTVASASVSVVIMNEAAVATSLTIWDAGSDRFLGVEISPRAIQTIVY
jgi:hypothetical protein